MKKRSSHNNNKSVIFLITHCNAQMSTTTSQPKKERYDGKGREISASLKSIKLQRKYFFNFLKK